MKTRKLLSATEFVKAWQTAESVTALAADLGITKQAASIRAIRFRKMGVPLRVFPKTGRPMDASYEELAAIAKKFAPKNGAKP